MSVSIEREGSMLEVEVGGELALLDEKRKHTKVAYSRGVTDLDQEYVSILTHALTGKEAYHIE